MGNFGVSSGARGFQLQLLCHWNNGKTGINAKMMFDEAQVFKGLSAWFSASVPTRLRSQWVKNGGIQSNDFHDADYIFSSNAAAKDTTRIFDSETYQKEELTIFHSSLIEDTLTNGKSCLSGKYAGAYILIHPTYQKEIDSFHKEQCSRSNVKLTKNEDCTESYPNTCSSYRDKVRNNMKHAGQSNHNQGSDEWEFEDACKSFHHTEKSAIVRHQEPNNVNQSDDSEWDFKDESDTCTKKNLRKLHIESSIRQQQIIEEPSDEWDFGDDSKLHIKNFIDARKQCETIVQSDRSNEMLHDSSQMNLNPTALKRPWVEPPPNREQEQTLLKLARKDTSNCCLSKRMRNSFCGNHSQNLMDHEREQDLYCGEYQRKSESCFQGVEERESFLSDSQLKNKATPETPKNYSKSQFLSSMDDGFVHIDDIKLPDSPIYDFIPNQNGCQVEPK